MTRRAFFSTTAALLPLAPPLRLEAIAAPELPQTMHLPARFIQPGAEIYELRTYRSRTHVYAFPNLTARADHWNTQPRRPGLTHLSLWRRSSC